MSVYFFYSSMNFSLVFIEKSVYEDNTAWYGIYLINDSDKAYEVSYLTWWFYSSDEKLIQLAEKKKILWNLLPYSRILVEESDIWQLEIQWYVTLNLKGETNYEISFTIWKYRPRWLPTHLDGFENIGILMDFEIK